MKSKKKATLADLEQRVAKWVAEYIAEHRLLALGQRFRLELEVEHHKTTHLYETKSKVGKAYPRASDEPMTEMDWNIILRLSPFRKPAPNTLFSLLKDGLTKMRDSKGGVELPYNHVQQLNTIFHGNGLMYHAFKVGGSISSPHWHGKAKFKIYKKL